MWLLLSYYCWRMKFYFNCNNNTQANVLREAGVKNVFLNYKYVHSNLDKIAKGFEGVIISGDKDTKIIEYYKFLEKLPDNYLKLQIDHEDPVHNLRFFQMGDAVDNLIPVFHGNYSANLSFMKPFIKDGITIALGNMKGIIVEDESLRKLPPVYKYHGLGKGRWWNNPRIESVDSSTWLSGVRGRKTDVFRGPQITFGKKGLTNKSTVQSVLKRNESNLELVGVKAEEVLEGEYNALMKVTLAVYYIPMFRSLDILKDNFIS